VTIITATSCRNDDVKLTIPTNFDLSSMFLAAVACAGYRPIVATYNVVELDQFDMGRSVSKTFV
jgi:hypothetical protein